MSSIVMVVLFFLSTNQTTAVGIVYPSMTACREAIEKQALSVGDSFELGHPYTITLSKDGKDAFVEDKNTVYSMLECQENSDA